MPTSSRIAGRYDLQEQLGEGGMGVVWRALDTKTGSYVAIKLMKDISDPVAVELFTKEWKALAELCHPNIVDVRDVDVIEENQQKKPFFVMPLLRGATLAELIANASARLTPERIVEITTQVCRGLQAAHQRGLVHRDLKPSNIFVMDDDTAKIIDFGVVHLAGSKSLTGQKGTFQYMSPEQAQLREITPASDLFSLGVILYEALTLRKPFARATAEETMEAVIKSIPPPLSEVNPNINQSISKVVHKCLAKQPIYRFSSARELAETLQRAVRNEAVFDPAKLEPRIERAKSAFKSGDEMFASEILEELEAEGNLDPRMTVLRMQIDLAVKEKKIRQLLESARARMEQDEIPLALDKLREVLELDPKNPDALTMREMMEKQRSETQVAKWFELAQTHLGNRDFSAARHAVREVLAIRQGSPKALELLEKIDSTEAEAKRIRDQKEQLYSSAMRAYQSGEIGTALSKLERLFSVARAHPDAAIPERDAVYQIFYKEVRSEHDNIHSALEEAQRHFSEKNFAGAMTVCRELMAKYPNDGTFQALKIRIEDAERQELSGYIAEVSMRLESEPDLDRRANILREACERYPNEAHFAQQLKLIRERRDLVNSIVAKARQYEERGQYAEALSQWDILRNIHPQYPGIAFELEQCKKKRDQQVRAEEHVRLVEEIDRLMESRAYAEAVECANSALGEFPGDAELAGLRTLAEQGRERTQESRRLFEEGQRAWSEKDFLRATELLRSSLSLDPRAPGLREGLVNVLVERARMLLDENWPEAERLCQEASVLDPGYPAVRVLRSSISEAKRQTFVGQCLTECRALVAMGKVQEATERVHAARREYPNDLRLEQYEASLQKESNEVRRRAERDRDRALLGEDRGALEQNPDDASLHSILERSYAIRARHPDDAEIGQSVADIELTVRRVARVDDLTQLRHESMTATAQRRSAEETKLFPTAEGKRKKSVFQLFGGGAAAYSGQLQPKVLEARQWAGKWSGARLAVVAGVIGLLAASGFLVYLARLNRPKPPVERPQPTPSVKIIPDPAESTVTSDGKPVTNSTVAVGSTIEVSRLGYITQRTQIQPGFDGKIVLEPEPIHLLVQTAAKSGTVALDGLKISDLIDGSMYEYNLVPDGKRHTLTVTAEGKQLFAVGFQAVVGSRPQDVTLDAKDLLVVTSLGDSATVFGGSLLKSVQLGEQNVPVLPSGTDVKLTDQIREISFGEDKDKRSLTIDIANAPGLLVRSLTTEGQLLITSNAPGAVLTVDGTPVRRQKRGWLISGLVGVHNFTMSAEGYQSQTWPMTLQRGQSLKKDVALALNARPPAMGSLRITGGTPGAEVVVDGTPVGQIDSNGDFELHDGLAIAKHTIEMKKQYHETRTLADVPVRHESAVLLIPNAALIPWPTIGFQVTPRNAAIRYHRVDEPTMHAASSSARIPLPPGEYEIVAEAPGFQEFKIQKTLNTGADVNLPVSLVPIADYEFLDPNQIIRDGVWIRSRNPGKFVYLKPAFLRQNLIFAKPGRNLFGGKKVEWVIELPEEHASVQYVFDGQKLTRKMVIGGAASDEKEARVDAVSAEQANALSLHVRVEAGRITITNDRGVVLDDYTVEGHDLSRARIGIKTDSEFRVKGDA